MAQRPRGKTRKLAFKLALLCGLTGAAVTAVTVTFVIRTFDDAIGSQSDEIVMRGWMLGMGLSLFAGFVVGVAAYLQGGALGSRLTDLGLGVARIGRGSAEVRIRYHGRDEIAALGRAIQYLASDIAEMAKEQEQAGGLAANVDPLVREMRDRALPERFPAVPGYEVDGAHSAGGRGGLDFYDCIASEQGAVLFLVSNEGFGAMSAVAAMMAREEIHRALGMQATPRKALAHTNRVLHQKLPKGVCAKACLLAIGPEGGKLYQAGFRAPVLLCAAGRVSELHAEGLALGLDEGQVFEKGLRSTPIKLTQGMRIVIANDAAVRLSELQALVAEHSAKHTAPFMNLVLGTLESNAGEGGLREDVVLLTAKRWS
jgi:hypothetical protein